MAEHTPAKLTRTTETRASAEPVADAGHGQQGTGRQQSARVAEPNSRNALDPSDTSSRGSDSQVDTHPPTKFLAEIRKLMRLLKATNGDTDQFASSVVASALVGLGMGTVKQIQIASAQLRGVYKLGGPMLN